MCNGIEKAILGVVGSLVEYPLDAETDEFIINEQLRIKPSSEGIMKFGNKRLKDFEEEYESSLNSLVSKGLLKLKDNFYELTEEGKAIGFDVRNQWLVDFYNDFLLRSAESETHAIFCEKVFGKNLCQYNVLDMEQLDTMLDMMNLQPNQLVLDIGCGLGKITEYIAEKTGVSLIGIDNASKVVEWAQKNTKTNRGELSFQVGDLNKMEFFKEKFDAIIAIDSLYYVKDFNRVLQKMKEILKPDGQIGIFYAQGRKPKESLEKINPEKTKVGLALVENGLQFDTIDFTKNGRGVLVRELTTAQELEVKFKEEGNHDLCQQRIVQSKDQIQRIDKKLERRYFYHVQKTTNNAFFLEEEKN
ncbi:MAG: methyltransferase domain-containing protein [Candidatus Heimdallarchaeota archaeon]|nr:methyltransferase domain-containing protein [Candidatus Heimdallarchaeota archaeon]